MTTKIKLSKSVYMQDDIQLSDQYIHYRFKYIMIINDNSDTSKGIIMLTPDNISALYPDNIYQDDKNNPFLLELFNKIKKDWHKRIHKISIDMTKITKIKMTKDLKTQLYNFINENITDDPIILDRIFDLYEQNIITVDVCFKLIKTISTYTEYDVRPEYLHGMIYNGLKNFYITLDETLIDLPRLPYYDIEAESHEYDYDLVEDDIKYYSVTPLIRFIPCNIYN